jgi:hypothetical protein
MIIFIMLITLGTMFYQQVHVQTDGWRGVVPLHSTRKDVERLIGPAYDASKSFYKTDRENISVRYSEGPCVGGTGWKVPLDTVLDITITPQPYGKIRLSDLDIDRNKFKKEDDHELQNHYYLLNEEAGITVYAYKDRATGEDRMTEINYKPAARDKNLHCKL